MMQVQNQMQKFHFSGKPKCTTPPQNRWLFVMSQIFIRLTQLQPEDHVKELHELQREFSINYATFDVLFDSMKPWSEILPTF